MVVLAAIPDPWWIRAPIVAIYSTLSFFYTFKIGRLNGQREAFITAKNLVDTLHADAVVSVYPAPVAWQDPDNRLH